MAERNADDMLRDLAKQVSPKSSDVELEEKIAELRAKFEVILAEANSV